MWRPLLLAAPVVRLLWPEHRLRRTRVEQAHLSRSKVGRSHPAPLPLTYSQVAAETVPPTPPRCVARRPSIPSKSGKNVSTSGKPTANTPTRLNQPIVRTVAARRATARFRAADTHQIVGRPRQRQVIALRGIGRRQDSPVGDGVGHDKYHGRDDDDGRRCGGRHTMRCLGCATQVVRGVPDGQPRARLRPGPSSPGRWVGQPPTSTTRWVIASGSHHTQLSVYDNPTKAMIRRAVRAGRPGNAPRPRAGLRPAWSPQPRSAVGEQRQPGQQQPGREQYRLEEEVVP